MKVKNNLLRKIGERKTNKIYNNLMINKDLN